MENCRCYSRAKEEEASNVEQSPTEVNYMLRRRWDEEELQGSIYIE